MAIQEMTLQEIEQVDGGLTYAELGLTVMGMGFAGGPFSAGFGLAIGMGMIWYGGNTNVRWP
jgi:hypothetical protein